MNIKINKKLLLLFVIIVSLSLLWILVISEFLTLETIKSYRIILLNSVTNYPLTSLTIFIGIYVLSITLSLPIATLLTLLAGFLFGQWAGTLIVGISATTGATLLFIAARHIVGEKLHKKAIPIYNKIELNMQKNTASCMLFLRLVPIFPFFLVNIVSAMFNVRLSLYITTTFLGILPMTFIYTSLGHGLGQIESLNNLVSLKSIIALSILGILSLTPIFLRKLK